MSARHVVLFLALLASGGCQSCYVQQVQPDEKLQNPVDEVAKPDRIRENIRTIGEEVPLPVYTAAAEELRQALPHSAPYLYEALKDESPLRRWNAIIVLRNSPNKREAMKHTAPLQDDPDSRVATQAAILMVEAGYKNAIPRIIAGLHDENPAVRAYCVEALRALTGRYFDFRPDDPKDRRVFCAGKWEDWWKREGASFKVR